MSRVPPLGIDADAAMVFALFMQQRGYPKWEVEALDSFPLLRRERVRMAFDDLCRAGKQQAALLRGESPGAAVTGHADVAGADADASLAPTITIQQAQDLTGLSVRHLRRLCDEGQLAAHKPGKFWLVDRAAAELLALSRNDN